MSTRQITWARRTKTTLRHKLGNACTWCGKTSKINGIVLQFDLIDSSDDTHHAIGYSHRMSFYRQAHARNNLQLLCESCHNKKSRAALNAEHAPLPQAVPDTEAQTQYNSPF